MLSSTIFNKNILVYILFYNMFYSKGKQMTNKTFNNKLEDQSKVEIKIN